MRNLLAFLKRFQIFLVFVLLQALAFSLYFSYKSFPRSQYLTTASIVSGNILTVRNEVTQLFSLSEENRKLQWQNKYLREHQPQSYIQVNQKWVRIDDSIYQQQYEFIPGKVINSTFDKRNNYFTLNVGRNQGVKRDMGVISDKGVVGVVQHVSEHFSVVKSVLTSDINFSVMVKKTGVFGLLKWNGKNARIGQVEGVSNDNRVKKWQMVVTRGGTGMFPEGIPVGKISRLGYVEGKPLWDIDLIYAEDFRKIHGVYVVRNILKHEQEKIENLIPIDEEE